jgi:hypothetical protein
MPGPRCSCPSQLAALLAGLLPSLAAGGWLALLPGVGLLSLLWSFGRDAWRQLVSARP